MDILLIALAATGTTAIIAPLALISAGIHRQEHASSLAAQPTGFGAVLARKVTALHGTPVHGSTLTCTAFGRTTRRAGARA
jgi:hypothetical protein